MINCIDMENWPRRKHFEHFRRMDYPHFNLCANVDISPVHKFLKQNGLPFFKTILYITTRAANCVKEFRYRIHGESVIEHDRVHPSFTVMMENETFNFCTVLYSENAKIFFQKADEGIESAKRGINLDDEPGRDDLLFVTSIPWVSFTSLAHPIHMIPGDSIPRISWGKYMQDGGRILLPLSIQANHALVDGLHVGKYLSALQELIDNPEILF